MGLGDLIYGATGLDEDEYQGSNLKGFISKFNSSDQFWVDTIDTLQSFDITFSFYPMMTPTKSSEKSAKKGFLEKLGDKIVDKATSAVKNIANNLTGGLLGSILQDMKDQTLPQLQNQMIGSNNGKMTSLDYLARGNLLLNTDGASNPQLVLDLSYYIQNVTIPNITIQDGGSSETLIGSYPVNGQFVKPGQNTFQINVINTKAPIAERIFYPWMREVTLPYWSYAEQPYTTATVKVDYQKHSDLQYIFVGCRPTNIETLQASNELGTPTRQITMTFDHMFVTSSLKARKSTKDNLKDLGKNLLNKAGSFIGI